jgi:Na+-transporting methylmalonyl-CoA/oxaloacetate decarboxylase gamma subunit
MTFVLFVLPALIIAMAIIGFYATKGRDRSDPEVRR